MKSTPLLGKLYLIPTTLGETENPFDVLPLTIKRSIELIDYYIVENEKTARKFIKSVLPEKVQATLRSLEKLSMDKNQSQIFIETPYRNNKMLEDILNALNPETHLCIAADITLPSEYIKTMRVVNWKKTKIDLHNRPTIFIIHKM
jgi:16S rRNA (cytidine1402-2'-O)-methyltransferase